MNDQPKNDWWKESVWDKVDDVTYQLHGDDPDISTTDSEKHLASFLDQLKAATTRSELSQKKEQTF